jgi:hypothetical protein
MATFVVHNIKLNIMISFKNYFTNRETPARETANKELITVRKVQRHDIDQLNIRSRIQASWLSASLPVMGCIRMLSIREPTEAQIRNNRESPGEMQATAFLISSTVIFLPPYRPEASKFTSQAIFSF